MREPAETVIGGKRYSVTPLPAMRALRLWPLVAKGFMVEGTALVNLSADEVERLARELLSMARVDGAELLPALDIVMCGDMPALMQLLSFAVNVNYSAFSADSDASAQAAGSGSGA